MNIASPSDLPDVPQQDLPDTRQACDRTELLFRLNGETFSVPVATVNEIIDPHKVSKVPNADPLVPGIVNVRGTIIPLFDIRTRLKMDRVENTQTSRMIVVEQTGTDGNVTRLAFCADSVDQVVERTTSHYDPLPELGVPWPVDCLAGTLRANDELVFALDTEKLFCINQLQSESLGDDALP